jgi:hypothetical protein
MKRPSTKEIAESNGQKLQQWIDDRYRLDDWADYLRDGALNRSLVAGEVGMPRSSLYTNLANKSLLDILEGRLRGAGAIPETKATTPEALVVSEREEKHAVELATRLKALEERNATLVAENRELKRKLECYQMIEDHLSQTGRLLSR